MDNFLLFTGVFLVGFVVFHSLFTAIIWALS
jgi:hypothetical protein